MKKIFLAIIMLISVCFTASAEMTEKEFLQFNGNISQIQSNLVENGEEFGIDLSEYNQLTELNKEKVIKHVVQYEYKTMDEFKENFYFYVEKYIKSSYIGTLEYEIKNDVYLVTPKRITENSQIIFVCYKGNKIVYIDVYTYNGETIVPFAPTTKEYGKVKIMVWDMEKMRPLTRAEEIFIG